MKTPAEQLEPVRMLRRPADRFFAQLATCRRSERQSFADAWVSIEPTFSNAKLVKKWDRLTDREGGEKDFFEHPHVLKKLKKVARALERRYREGVQQHDPACCFKACDLQYDRDPWDVARANLRLYGGAQARRGGARLRARGRSGVRAFEVRLGIDPETFEFSIKPIPLSWFYDARFVRFLDLIVWGVPRAHGLTPSIGHGGGQFSFSAKTFLKGSLLADDIATKLNHPELSSFIFDFPNADDRCFRATARRFRAFEAILGQYWSGAFHPKAIGTLTVENAFLDRGFSPAFSPPPRVMDPRRGPLGTAREVFQTNFAFGRKVRWNAQNVDPGYWQGAHPDEDGYRPDQVMRYSEGNLNRLQIAGEWHVKSGKVLDAEDIVEFDQPLDLSMLYEEACWEQRAQMSKASATDMVEAVLLEAHHAQWLLAHPHVEVESSLLQDQLLGDAERTLARTDPRLLDQLKREALAENLAASRKRVKSDRIEPETLFWAAWHSLSNGERAEIAVEAVAGFLEHVERAATKDPRRSRGGDPMEPHRHRVHPLLWKALEAAPRGLARQPALARELRLWQENRKLYLARRPPWSVTKARPPWKRSFSLR
jgi:hypothetical protein